MSNTVMKRLIDTFLVLVCLPFWLPLLAAASLAVLIVDGRPVFFRHTRAGKDGVPFDLLKLRTMRAGDEPDAERISRLGRFLRASSLDELPELVHVLSGKMSLVGPRPLPVRYLPRYSPEQARRHEVRPGITGWAQTHGRNLLGWNEKFAYDVWYVDHRSLALDALILFRTFAQLLAPRGIHAEGEATMTEFKPEMNGGDHSRGETSK